MEDMKETKRLLQLEFDIQHINVLSRKNNSEHAVIRLIISSLATSEEIRNLRKENIRTKSQNSIVILESLGNSRVSPIDDKTYTVLNNLTKKLSKKEKIFSYTEEDLDDIVDKYSPVRKKYRVGKLREAVMEILNDCMLFNDKNYVDDLIKGKNSSGLLEFLNDFHPLYAGTWDIEDDDDVAREFILSYSSYTGIEEPERIAKETGEDKERVSKFLE